MRGRAKGLGFGLAVVNRIARLLEHPINDRSVLGGGSTISVEVALGQTIVQPVEHLALKA